MSKSLKKNDDAEDDFFEINDEVAEAFREVPEIGAGKRWYDYPYRFLLWAGSGKKADILPKRLSKLIWKKINDLIPYNEYERYSASSLGSKLCDFSVPDKTHVNTLGLWVIELFPPSYLDKLSRSMKSHNWHEREARELEGRSNEEKVRAARAKNTSAWWRLGSVASPNFHGIIPDAVKEDIPKEFSYIDLKAIQVGSGLTAVIAFFCPSPEGKIVLDKEWHTAHEPILVRKKGKRPKAYDRAWSSMLATQQRRAETQNLARTWMAQHCPGFFSDADKSQPVIDMLLFDQPHATDTNHILNKRNAYRALGLDGIEYVVSNEMPGCAFIPSSEEVRGGLHDCAALAADRAIAIDDVVDKLKIYGREPEQSLSHYYEDKIGYFLLISSINSYSEKAFEKNAARRDAAIEKFGKYKISGLEKLRKTLLSESFDVAEIQSCYELPWSELWRSWYGTELYARFDDGFINTYDYAAHLHKQTKANMEHLCREDAIYRDILSTASSLGSSSFSLRLSKTALLVSLVSLLVAILALLLTDISNNNLLSFILRITSN